jgi:catechol 2,3-dioxygenase-like lactoylglutathione lyase family enzyme
MLKGVANIWMPVQDIERAVDFYENILGLPVVFQPEGSLEETVDDLKGRGVTFPAERSSRKLLLQETGSLQI